MAIKEQLQNKIAELKGDVLLIHSDLRHGFEIPIRSEEDFFRNNINALQSLKTGINIWMPVFNYDYCKGIPYDVSNTRSQVGGLTEYFRKSVAEWRTLIPVFSFAGTGEQPGSDISGIIDPFGIKSAFHFLYEKDALLMHYGSQFLTSTILHYVERISGRLNYRYDKLFQGKVINRDGKEIAVTLNYHVRPFQKRLTYDHDRLEKELLEHRILTFFTEGRTRISLCKIRTLVDYWKNEMLRDPLYFLDKESRMWVEPLLDKLGRPFVISDFESPETL